MNDEKLMKKISFLVNRQLIKLFYNKLMQIIQFVYNLLFPPECLNCNKLGAYLCPACSKLLKPSHPECYICRRISPNYATHQKCLETNRYAIEQITFLWKYDALAAKLIATYKYKSAFALSTLLNSLISERAISLKLQIDPNVLLIPIPLHKNRYYSRGFNQSEKLSQIISTHYNLSINSDLLMRGVDTAHQAHLSKEQRELNLQKAFYINRDWIPLTPHLHFILVDDVVTTGNTLNKAAIVLRKAFPASKIEAFALFRADFHTKRQGKDEKVPDLKSKAKINKP
ncbi:MAG: ComF family protein [Candidatus Dojkabacteria bacterium]